VISPAKFQPPNPSITATNGIPRFWGFGRFVWKSKKLPNFFIFDKLLSFLFWISWFGYLKVHHVEFSSNLSLVWLKIKFFKIRGIWLKMTRKFFNYDQYANSLAFSRFKAFFH
jgi:hypothetical protein